MVEVRVTRTARVRERVDARIIRRKGKREGENGARLSECVMHSSQPKS